MLADLLPTLRDYVRDPTAREDRGHPRPHLVAEIDEMLERLEQARALLSVGRDSDRSHPPRNRTLRAHECSLDSVVGCVPSFGRGLLAVASERLRAQPESAQEEVVMNQSL